MSHAHALTYEREDLPGRGAVVYRLGGVLGETSQCWRLLDEIRAALKAGPACLVLDLGGIEMLTSPGVGILASCYNTARSGPTRFAVCALPRQARDVLEVCGLLPVLPVHADREAALAG